MKKYLWFSLITAISSLVLSCGIPGAGDNSIIVSGSLTGAYSSIWKVGVGYESGNAYILNGVGSIDGMGKFSVSVAKNLGGKTVYAFYDINANNKLDSGERVSYTQPPINIGSDNFSGITIDVPVITMVTLSGTLTNHFAPGWKVILGASSILHLTTDRCITPDSSGYFSINVEAYTISVQLSAFRDDNGNNIFDPAELISPDVKTFSISNISVSNIKINIPEFSLKTISGTLKGNVFGLSVGVVAYDDNSGQMAYSTPSTAMDIPFDVSLLTADSNEIRLYYYIDGNGNHGYDGSPANMITENIGLLTTFYGMTNQSGLTVNLVPKMVTGNITGSGAADMKSVYIFSAPAISYFPVSGGTYTLKFYTGAIGTTNSSLYLLVISPDEETGIVNMLGAIFVAVPVIGKNILSTNDPVLGNNYTGKTNTVDFPVSKYGIMGIISGADASLFKFGLLDSINSSTYDMVFKSYPQNTVKYIYSYGTVVGNTFSCLFKDENGDNQVILNEINYKCSDPIFLSQKTFSNQVVYTNKFFVYKTSVNLTVSGNLTGYVNPRVYAGSSSLLGVKTYTPVSQTVEIYSELSNTGYNNWLLLFSDVDGDGEFFPFYDKIISTNTVSWTTPVISTNLTLYITNHL